MFAILNNSLMKQFVVYFNPLDRKINFNQYHLLASSVEDALTLVLKSLDFEFTLLGIKIYDKNDDLSLTFKPNTLY